MMFYAFICKLCSTPLSFGKHDAIDCTPVEGTSQSSTIRWKEDTMIGKEAASSVGYYIYYREFGDIKWNRGVNVTMDTTSDWQQGSVYGLKPDTVYAIDISVYRIHPTGQVYENTDDTSTLVQPLQITTLPGE